MVTQSLKINWVSVTYNSGLTESQFYVVFPCPGKKKKKEVWFLLQALLKVCLMILDDP